MNLRRRLQALEKGSTGEAVVLRMPDGSTRNLPGHNDYVRGLLAHVARGERTPETELIARSISSTEPDGAHMIDLARAILNSPN